MPFRAFNQDIVIRLASYPLTPQGGANPVFGDGYPRKASVQPMGGRANLAKAGSVGDMPESATRYEVLLPWSEDDPAIEQLAIGDQIEWKRLILSVLEPPKDSGGLGAVHHIPCEVVT